MENKTSYTLQYAKNEVAKRYGYDKWFDIDFYQVDSNNNTTKPPYSEEALRDEAAELYKEKATEELTERLKAAKAMMETYYSRSEELRKENEELKSTVERLSQAYRYIHASRNSVDEEMKGLIEIHHLQSQELLSEIERLKELNKELVDEKNTWRMSAIKSFIELKDNEEKIKAMKTRLSTIGH